MIAASQEVAADPLEGVEGPLRDLIPVFVDVEMFVSKRVSLSNMTLRQYCAESYLTAISIAIGNDLPAVIALPDGVFVGEDEAVPEGLAALAKDPKYIFVAHNAAFDIRVLRLLMNVPHPCNVWCTMEGAMGAWPELVGGYGLANCSRALKFPKTRRKFELNLERLGAARVKVQKAAAKGTKTRLGDLPEELLEQIAEICKCSGIELVDDIVTCELLDDVLLRYNERDVVTMQELYYRQIKRLPPIEQEIALLTHGIRKHHFEVDIKRLDNLVTQLSKNAAAAEERAEDYVTDPDDIRQIFNRETSDGSLRSIRYTRLRRIVNGKMGASELDTVSLKKLSPVDLAKHPRVANLLEQTSRASKMIYHARRSAVFEGVPVVDAELGYMRAHTGRFSSPSVGKGLNLHNIPKHDKAVAKPVRQLFQLPSDLCFVRADLANVEYRVEGMLTGCQTVMEMFDPVLGGDPMADPYVNAWKTMTGVQIVRGTPAGDALRQVSKGAVLGLGFQMSAAGYAKVLLKAIAMGDVTEEGLMEIIVSLNWEMPRGNNVERIVNKLGCSTVVAVAAFHIHRVFQEAHPEFAMISEWLVSTVSAVAQCGTAYDSCQLALDKMFESPKAPDRNMIDLFLDIENGRVPSIRVKCGPWVPTVCWREPKMRLVGFNKEGFAGDSKLTIRKASGQMKPFIKQLAIENITQAAARNSLCRALIELKRRGYEDVLHVHDELLLIVPKFRSAVLHARDALLEVLGPDAPPDVKPMRWATLIKPSEISITQSMYEDEDDVAKPYPDKKTGEMRGNDRWGKIEAGVAGCLDNLP